MTSGGISIFGVVGAGADHRHFTNNIVNICNAKQKCVDIHVCNLPIKGIRKHQGWAVTLGVMLSYVVSSGSIAKQKTCDQHGLSLNLMKSYLMLERHPTIQGLLCAIFRVYYIASMVSGFSHPKWGKSNWLCHLKLIVGCKLMWVFIRWRYLYT